MRPPSSHTTGRTQRIRRFRLTVQRLARFWYEPRICLAREEVAGRQGSCSGVGRRGPCGSMIAVDRVTPFPPAPWRVGWGSLAGIAHAHVLGCHQSLRVCRDCSPCVKRFGPWSAAARGTPLGVLPRRTTTASADFSVPVPAGCPVDSPCGQAWRSPTVSRSALGFRPRRISPRGIRMSRGISVYGPMTHAALALYPVSVRRV